MVSLGHTLVSVGDSVRLFLGRPDGKAPRSPDHDPTGVRSAVLSCRHYRSDQVAGTESPHCSERPGSRPRESKPVHATHLPRAVARRSYSQHWADRDEENRRAGSTEPVLGCEKFRTVLLLSCTVEPGVHRGVTREPQARTARLPHVIERVRGHRFGLARQTVYSHLLRLPGVTECHADVDDH